MPNVSDSDTSIGRRFALCIGIGQYTELANHDLRYAVLDAQSIADVLKDTQRGKFQVTLLTEPTQTTEDALNEALDVILNATSLNLEDLVVVYISCHGSVYGNGNTFYLLPSNAKLEGDGLPKKTTVIDIHNLAKTLSGARVKNIILLLDTCYSGGAGNVLQYLDLRTDLSPDTNLFIIGAARHDRTAVQSSKAKHGIFTACLLEAFKQKPNRRDGWLTISEIHSFITEQIKLYENESLLQFRALSLTVNPNLLLIKNPRYSSESIEFYEQVKKLLTLVQYEPIDTEYFQDDPPGLYAAEIKVGLTISRVGIVPYYNEVEAITDEEAEKVALYLKEQINLGRFDHGIIVTDLEVSNKIEQVFRTIGGRLLEVQNYQSIWKGLIDFKRYLMHLINDYNNFTSESNEIPLAQVYIPLKAEKRVYDFERYKFAVQEMFPSNKSKRQYSITWQGDLEVEIEKWLLDATSTKLAIVADYGSGKTTFCKHIAARLSQKYLEGKEQGIYEGRIPLLIPLLEFAKSAFDLESFLSDYLKRQCRVDNPDVEALMKMAEAGMFFFILDGFDEMASRANNNTIRQNILLFEQLAALSQNKVLLTTRPEYFMDIRQEQKILRSYDCLYLQLFDEQQIDYYLQRRISFAKAQLGELIQDWTYYRSEINRIHDLSDLARRPVLLEMIIKTLPALIAENKVINRPNLYQRYLEGELERQLLKQRRDLIDMKKRFEIMEQIALEMYLSDKVEFSSDQILKMSSKLLTIDQQGEMEGSLRDILTCSFLIRDGDRYRYSHQSFTEYLVACHLAKDITVDEQENWQRKLISPAVRGFLIELDTNFQKLQYTTNNVTDMEVSFEHMKLAEWFKKNTQNSLISSNIISILVKLVTHEQLCGLPLRGADLRGADLRGADLRGADLRGADFRQVSLNDTNLSSVKLNNANLNDADLSQAKLIDADLSNAKLNGADLSRVDLSRANLRYADLSNTNLNHANISFANLEHANLNYAHLRYANLYNAVLLSADLNGVDFFGADLSRADLRGADLSDLDLRQVSLSGTDLSGANLAGVDLSGTYLNGANLNDTDLSSTNLSGINLSGIDLSGSYLGGAYLNRTDLRGADLSGADLSGADLQFADLSWANLLGADLSGADLRNMDLRDVLLANVNLSDAVLSKANLKEIDLRGTNLSGADLSGADLSNANLDGAYLSGADLSGADLSNASVRRVDISEANLEWANLSNTDLRNTDLTNIDRTCVDLSVAIIDEATLNLLNEDKIMADAWSNFDFEEWYGGPEPPDDYTGEEDAF